MNRLYNQLHLSLCFPVIPTDPDTVNYHLSLARGDSVNLPPSRAVITLGSMVTSVSEDSNVCHQLNMKKALASRIGRSGSNGEFCGGHGGNGAGGGGGGGSRHVSESKIQSLFAKYKDPVEDAILSEGVEALCLDLELKPEDFRVLVLAWRCNVDQMCRFTRTEFVTGCRALKADTLRAIQQRLPEHVAEMKAKPELFKDLYRFTFRFGLEPGQKVLPVEMAVSLWVLVFSQQEVPLLHRWVSFLKAHPQVRGIPRDTWNMFLNLVEAVGSDLSLYDDTEAWPSLFDDFFEYENDKANQNVVGKRYQLQQEQKEEE